jgi:hypothetical protein
MTYIGEPVREWQVEEPSLIPEPVEPEVETEREEIEPLIPEPEKVPAEK